MNDQYFPIHPQSMRIDTSHSFEVFRKNELNEFVIFQATGETYTSTLHRKLFQDSVGTLFIRKGSVPDYHKYLERHFEAVFADELMGPQSKSIVAHQVLTLLANHLFEQPSADLITRYKTIIEAVASFILREEEAITHLISLTQNSYSDPNHVVNVGIYGMGLARELLKTDEHNMPEIAAGFFLHDLGRYKIPKYIFQRKGPLTEEDWKLIKKHPEEGNAMLEQFGLETEETSTIMLQHHERHDGSGYPKGLSGDSIHTYSKICTIADTFDALTSYRPYRSSSSSYKALQLMHAEMKKEFDPDFFAHFVRLFSKDQAL